MRIQTALGDSAYKFTCGLTIELPFNRTILPSHGSLALPETPRIRIRGVNGAQA